MAPDETASKYLRRIDVPLLTGSAPFGADVRDGRLDGAGYVAFVRSVVAYGAIEGVDVDVARAAPGVRAVVTSADLPIHPIATLGSAIDIRYVQPFLAEQVVRHVGEPIAAIVADSPAAAVDAAELVIVDYDERDPIVDPDDAAAGPPIFRPEEVAVVADGAVSPGSGPWPTNVVTSVRTDVDDSKFDMPVVVRLRFDDPRQSPCPIEPRVMACGWDGEDLYVWNATQKPHAFRAMLSRIYETDPARIHVVAGPFVGGGFGGKTSRSVEEYLLPYLARLTNAPVRWNETRSEYFLSSTQGRGERLDVTIAGDADGSIAAVRVELLKDAGAYPGVGVLLPEAYSLPMAQGPYDIAHVEFASTSVVTNTPSTSAYRGAGRASLIAALERGVDCFARHIGRDPADVRRANLIPRAAMPYATSTGARYDEADYQGDLERALSAVNYDAVRAEQAERRKDRDGPQLGIGIACYNHLTGGVGGENAVVTVHSDASATIVTGSTTQGHGHESTWSLLASSVLGIRIEDITVVEGDTDKIPTGEGAVGSRSAQTAGISVHRAATDAVARGCELAASVLEANVADIVFDPGHGQFSVAGSPTSALGWSEVLGVATDVSGQPVSEVSCGDHFDPAEAVFPSGTHIAVVELDPLTGAVRVIDFVAVDDAGVRIHPAIVEGQLHGGIASGIAHALGESMSYDEYGTPLTANLMGYPLAGAEAFPPFRLEASVTPTTNNALGIKAVGESGAIGATPAVHNAVVDALGVFDVEHLDLPLTPQRIWAAIDAATA